MALSVESAKNRIRPLNVTFGEVPKLNPYFGGGGICNAPQVSPTSHVNPEPIEGGNNLDKERVGLRLLSAGR